LIDISTGSGLDVAAIMPVMDDAFDPQFGEAWTSAQCLSTLALPGSQLLIARQQGRIVGFALSRWVVDEEELLLIGVLQSARRSGVGRALLAMLVSKAHEQNRVTIFLEVRDDNTAQSFYREIGFVPTGRRNGYYKGNDGSRRDSITMQMDV
jgi:[ribosomal protein S18]-alanine N-acetyltransferase